MNARPSGSGRVDPSSVRITIAEEHRLSAECLDLVLTMKGYDVLRVETARFCSNVDSLQLAVLRTRPRLAILGLNFGAKAGGARLIASLSRAGVAVVVLAATEDRARWGEWIAVGARKVVSKEAASVREVTATIHGITHGLPVMGRGEREHLLELWSRQRPIENDLWTRLTRLTNREAEILGDLTLGRTVKEVARRSVVSEATVRSQIKSILAKLEVSSQIAAVALARAADWRSPGD